MNYMDYIVKAMIYLGSALMVFNIAGFIRFAIKSGKRMKNRKKTILYIPIILLVLFLLGYLAVGIFGDPDIIVSGILFGGSIFVFIMYILLDRITKQISEQDRLEAKLMATEESDRAKTEFLSGVSHEMRTPLNVILGLDTMVLKDGTISAETRERVDKIDASAKHLLSLINNILDMNSIETGEFIAKSGEFDLSDTVSQLNSIAKARCEGKGLTYVCDSSVPAGDYYIGDEMRLKQTVLSLLDNAIKFTDAGTVALTVDTGDEKDGVTQLRFTVRDTGIGISEEFLPRVFDMFAKEDSSATSSYSGSGLGLAVTKGIVEQLGGAVTVQSEKYVGSSFTVTLPMKHVSKEAAASGVVSLEGKRVLIVEDIAENAEIVADLLELEGALSEHAENGKIAVNMFCSSEPGYYDVILMDLRMPEMDGLTAAKKIRASGHKDAKTVPIIALTANAFESDVKESLEAGMNLHLAKPTDSDKLYAAIKKVLSQSGTDKKANV